MGWALEQLYPSLWVIDFGSATVKMCQLELEIYSNVLKFTHIH